ncbi:hypothetical protein LTR02_005491 [Friedmanniomyces endolithicus]|nr:hypothetical protein LTR94_006773 [Friedmanniomyces endolithicus]KAK0803919.1 hypothetical protein LTR38_005977 [Friedmanniomyces endolithicus]KAK0907369.1 hypothetical protein LTR02_005491 [Friedmanniomyces endolithicus]KAK0985999.1 hypothetical protein LTS01_010088 [Friedmanniomyces endolithicus]
MSRHSTPTYGLGKLTLRDRDVGMPVTTRARSGQTRDLQISQATSSRPSAGPPSMQPAARPGSSRATPSSSRLPPNRRQVASAPGGDSSDDDSDGSDGTGGGGQEAAGRDNDRLATIYQMMCPFNEDGLSPPGFAASNNRPDLAPGTQLAHRVVGALYALLRDDDGLNTLRTWIQVPGPQWSTQLATNMYRRFQTITDGLRRNAAGQGGQDVVRTIDALRGLYVNIDDIRIRYFGNGMDAVHQRSFMTLLVRIMEYIVQNNEDLYRGTNRPAYAGEGNRNERRLFSCFLADESQPGEFLRVLRNSNGHLAHEIERLRSIRTVVLGYAENGVEGGVEQARLARLAGAFTQLVQISGVAGHV